MGFAKMSAEQWAVCEEIVQDLRRQAGALTAYDLDDPFQYLIRTWAVYLAILGWEMLESVLILTRAGKLRAAFALSRTLIEYYIRMSYYHQEIEKVAGPWRASGELGPAGMNIVETHAYRDWSTATAMMRKYMRKMPDLSFISLTRRQRAKFEIGLRRSEKIDRHTWFDMRNFAEAANQDRNDFVEVEYGMRSGYLHGNQGAFYEVCQMHAEQRGGLPSFEGQFSEHRVAGYAAQYAVLLMDAIGNAVGRHYGAHYLGPKIAWLFRPEALKRARITVRGQHSLRARYFRSPRRGGT